MTAIASLPVIRVRVSCADTREYLQVRAREFAARGVAIHTERVRPIGARVHLKIELLDRTMGHDGEAIVASHLGSGPRAGYVLKLAAAVDGCGTTPPALPLAPRAPAAAPESVAASAPVSSSAASPSASQPEAASSSAPAPTPAPAADLAGGKPSPVDLAAFLFSDVCLADVAPADPGPLDLAPIAPPARRAAPPPASARAAARAPDEARVAVRAPFGPGDEDEAPEPLDAPPPASAARPAPPRLDPPVLPRVKGGLLERLRHLPRPAALLGAVVLLSAAGSGPLLMRGRRDDPAAADLSAALRRADDRLASGRLAGPGDNALDHLLAARALAPRDPRLGGRLKVLADVLGELGDRALVRGDLDEATAHLQAALRADPARDALRQRLRDLADRPGAPPGR